jgi:hypothetical protein
MGIKKTGKKLMKIGKKVGKSLGKGGTEFVEAILQTAIGTLETELKKKTTSGKKPGEQAASHPRGPAPARNRSARRRLTQRSVKTGPPAATRPHLPASTTRRTAAGDQPRRPRAAVSPVEESHSPV